MKGDRFEPKKMTDEERKEFTKKFNKGNFVESKITSKEIYAEYLKLHKECLTK